MFNDRVMSPGSASPPPPPAAAALAAKFASTIGSALLDERRRRGWTTRDVAGRARVSAATVTNVEAGRSASIATHARLAVALGLSLDVSLAGKRRRTTQEPSDLVHAAMGELEARWLAAHGYEIAIDHPYQHYQFAGRADVLAWTRTPAALLHVENRSRFPDLQQAAGSYNAKRQYLARVVADQSGIRRFESETHVMVGLWSAEVVHVLWLRSATFQALCPDPGDRLSAWMRGQPPATGRSSSSILLDPFASRRQAATVELAGALTTVKPRVRGYREAADRIRSGRSGPGPRLG